MKHIPIIGTTYGKYTVISEQTKRSNDLKVKFHVKCSCGKEEFKIAYALKTGRSKSCKSCSSKLTFEKHPLSVNFKGIGDLSMTFFSHIKEGAVKRNINFELTPEFVWNLFVNQSGKCALSGVTITLSKKIKDSNPSWKDITASLDRIDSNKGYLENNVWWVHKDVNRLKNNYSVQELLYWCNLISSHGNPEPSSMNDIKVVEKVQRLTGEKSNNNPDTKSHLLEIKDEDIV